MMDLQSQDPLKKSPRHRNLNMFISTNDDVMGSFNGIPSGYVKIAIENGHL